MGSSLPFRSIQIGTTPIPLSSFIAAIGPVMLVNNDTINTIWISSSRSVSPTGSDSIPIPALGSISLSPQDLWAVSNVPNVQLLLVPTGTQWAPSPAQVATQINALGLAKDTSVNNPSYQPITLTNAGLLTKDSTLASQTAGGTIASEIAVAGAPLLHKHVGITAQSNLSITGTAQTFGPFTITQPGYQVFFSLFMTAQQNSYLMVEMKWFDSTSGIQIDDQRYFMVPGTDSSTNLHTLVGQGPTSGDQLTITLQLVGTAGTITVPNFMFFQNSRALLPAKHIWKTWAYANFSINGGPATNVSADPKGNLLGLWSVSVPAASALSFYPPLYTGSVTVYVLTASGTTDCQVNVNALADTIFGTGQRIAQFQTDSHGVALIQQFALPRSQVQFTMNNGNAAAKSINLVLQSSVTE